MTADEFLVWPGDGFHKFHQLIDGRPVPLSPASWVHGLVSTELAGYLNAHFRSAASPCRAIVDPGIQPRAGATLNVRIPDVAVSCAPIVGRLMRAPVFCAEVLSPSNESETREAVRNYLTIPSVREVLVLGSLVVAGELLRRGPDGDWPEDPLLLGPDDDIVLQSFGFRHPLAALYPG